MEKLDLQYFPVSESAKKMLGYVSDGFYDASYVGKWLFEIMGREYDMALEAVEELPAQFFPETATWGLMYHEVKWGLPVRMHLPDEERRKLIYQKRDFRSPMTPYRMERYLQDATGFEVHVADVNDTGKYGFVPPHPNVFKVYFVGKETLDSKLVHKLLNRLKQSHTTYTVNDRMELEINNHDLEKIFLQNVRFKMMAMFWYDRYIYNEAWLFDGTWQPDGTWLFDGAWLFDGTWELDGAWKFDSTVAFNVKRRYGLVLGLRHKMCTHVREDLKRVSLGFSGKIRFDEMFISTLRYCFSIGFWNTLYFDGLWELDGSIILSQRERYNIALNISHRYEIRNDTEYAMMNALKTKWRQHVQEEIIGHMLFGFSAEFWQLMYLDGEWDFDGEILLNSNRCRARTALKMCAAMDFSQEERVEDVTVETKTRDYWFLDGILLSDGSRRFNSIYRKETVE